MCRRNDLGRAGSLCRAHHGGARVSSLKDEFGRVTFVCAGPTKSWLISCSACSRSLLISGLSSPASRSCLPRASHGACKKRRQSRRVQVLTLTAFVLQSDAPARSQTPATPLLSPGSPSFASRSYEKRNPARSAMSVTYGVASVSEGGFSADGITWPSPVL